jgi:hypothetical protein
MLLVIGVVAVVLDVGAVEEHLGVIDALGESVRDALVVGGVVCLLVGTGRRVDSDDVFVGKG